MIVVFKTGRSPSGVDGAGLQTAARPSDISS